MTRAAFWTAFAAGLTLLVWMAACDKIADAARKSPPMGVSVP